MNILDVISTRRSVREFTSQPISDDDLHTILAAGMSGPSAVNARPWSFLVVRSRDTLCKMADGNGSAAQLLKGARVAFIWQGAIMRSSPLSISNSLFSSRVLPGISATPESALAWLSSRLMPSTTHRFALFDSFK